ncbi:MAG TPA: YicC family protein [Candidatus Omnitrophota bacterium]|nr:YicC family protein [Candidatus Omnitrophota bacterium]
MIKGMTGFGQAQLSSGKIKAIIEVKSVNQRYLDVNYFLPPGFGSLESKIRQMIQKEIQRGRVTVSLKIIEKQTQEATLNRNIAQIHLRNAARLKKEFGIKGDLSLSDLVRLPGVLEIKETHLSPEALWPVLSKGFEKAIKSLLLMRMSEGRSLAKDVLDKLKSMSLQIKKIQKKAQAILSEKKSELTNEEFRSFQRGADVNEEVTRLLHYIDEIRPLLKNGTSVGKKIDFIAQEMLRETNTIGSKLQDKVVSNAVISLKSKIEKIREQSQNIE